MCAVGCLTKLGNVKLGTRDLEWTCRFLWQQYSFHLFGKAIKSISAWHLKISHVQRPRDLEIESKKKMSATLLSWNKITRITFGARPARLTCQICSVGNFVARFV